jgi:2-methylcitrate synthase/citrate synthase II
MAGEPSKGLAGVVADYTAISTVNEETNSLLYRGYAVEELARSRSMEETAWLLWRGELPTAQELDQLRGRLVGHSAIPEKLQTILESLPEDSHPMDVTRTALSVLGNLSPLASRIDLEAEQEIAEQLFAVLPAVVAGIQRRRMGLPPIPPREDLAYTENFLWMSFGKEFPEVVNSAFQTSMILYAEHSFNASTFAARVITSTLSDMYSAMTGAIGSLRGPLHGGANEGVMRMLNEIPSLDQVEPYIMNKIKNKDRIMGFGHRVYKAKDPRAAELMTLAKQLADDTGNSDLYEKSHAIELIMEREYAAKGIYPNVDFYSATTYHCIGLKLDLFTPMFALSRIAGWAGHVIEQLGDNRLFRPTTDYVGPHNAPYTPIDER